MKIKNLILALFLSLGVAACSGGGSGEDDDGTVTFSIILSANCSGQVSSAEVYFDDRFVATLTPSGSTDVVTFRGEHKIEAQANTGATWGPIHRDIQGDGGSQTLTC